MSSGKGGAPVGNDISAKMQTMRTHVDALIECLQPSPSSEVCRKEVLVYLRELLVKKGLEVYQNGSFAWKTYLPDSDVDVGVIGVNNDLYNSSARPRSPTQKDSACLMAVNETLCFAGCEESDNSHHGEFDRGQKQHHVRNVSFVNGHVKVVKCVINNITVDVCRLSRPSLAAVSYFEALDRLIGVDHLFKKSVILIKAWCSYEGGRFAAIARTDGGKAEVVKEKPVLGARFGGLSSYGLSIMIAALFVQHMRPSQGRSVCSIKHPLDALVLFLNYYSSFSWESTAVSMFGPIPLRRNVESGSAGDAASTSFGDDAASSSNSKKSLRIKSFQQKLVTALRQRAMDGSLSRKKSNGGDGSSCSGRSSVSSPCTTTSTSTSELSGRSSHHFNVSNGMAKANTFIHEKFSVRACNIVDPFDLTNNLGRSMNVNAFQSLKNMLKAGRANLFHVLQDRHTSIESGMESFFRSSLRKFSRGDGWRPDLLLHPCQKWYDCNGVTGASSVDNSAKDSSGTLDVDHDELDRSMVGIGLLSLAASLGGGGGGEPPKKEIVEIDPVEGPAAEPHVEDPEKPGSPGPSSPQPLLMGGTIQDKDVVVPTFSQDRDGREADQSVIVADAVLLPSESSRRMEQEDCDRIAMDKLGKPSAGDQWSFTKIMFYIIFGYLSLAQVRQEVNSILKGALAPPPEDAARTAFVAPDARRATTVRGGVASFGMPGRTPLSHGAAGKDIFDAEKVPSTDAPLGSVELLGAEDAVAFEARAAKNAERTLKSAGTVPSHREGPPVVHSHISNQWVSTGSQVIFRVNVDWKGEQMLKFQWRRNGVDIPRATDHLMVLGAATVEDEGTYTCAVSNRQGDTVIWEESVLHVASPPIVKSDFSHILVLPGDSISLGVHVLAGSPKPKFQWRMNGVDIPGAISEKYTILSASEGDVGTYTCMVANLAGSVVWEEVVVLIQGVNPLKARRHGMKQQTPAVELK